MGFDTLLWYTHWVVQKTMSPPSTPGGLWVCTSVHWVCVIPKCMLLECFRDSVTSSRKINLFWELHNLNLNLAGIKRRMRSEGSLQHSVSSTLLWTVGRLWRCSKAVLMKHNTRTKSLYFAFRYVLFFSCKQVSANLFHENWNEKMFWLIRIVPFT